MLLFPTLVMLESQGSPTLAYGDTQDDIESQDSDMGTSLKDFNVFPTTDATIRKRRDTTSNHTVFVKTPTIAGEVPSPCSTLCDTLCDMWDDDHVKMPCSKRNLYPGTLVYIHHLEFLSWQHSLLETTFQTGNDWPCVLFG